MHSGAFHSRSVPNVNASVVPTEEKFKFRSPLDRSCGMGLMLLLSPIRVFTIFQKILSFPGLLLISF